MAIATHTRVEAFAKRCIIAERAADCEATCATNCATVLARGSADVRLACALEREKLVPAEEEDGETRRERGECGLPNLRLSTPATRGEQRRKKHWNWQMKAGTARLQFVARQR